MKIILNRCNEDTKAEIALSSSYENNLKAEELIRFLVWVCKVSNITEDADVFFGSRVTKITKHHFWPTTIIEQLLAAHSNNDDIWDNKNQCDVSLENSNDTEALANVHVTKE